MTLEDHRGRINIKGRFITNCRFADDAVVNAEGEVKAYVLGPVGSNHR